MSLLTSLLKLFKWNTTDETDLEQEFDIDKAMNDNWDKLDEFAERVNDAVIEIQDDIEEIQNKNTEQDETINTINESISSIQAKDEAQDTEINKQIDLIQKLKDNCINVTTEEATSLHVTDASILPAKLDVRGNHSQETTKGIQILENTNDGTTGWGWSTSPSNVGVIKEVSYLGTKACKFSLPENSYAWKFLWRNVNRGKLKNNTTYTIQFDAKTNYNENITIAIQNMAAQNKLVNFGTININGEKRVKVVANSNTIEILDQILYIYADNIANASGRELIITNLILIEGDYSNTDIEWEKYTGLQGSPSLDYPSPVRAVGDNVNMFNVWESGTISNSGNIESSDIAIRTADFISVKSNTSYTYKIYDETISNIALFEYDENSNFIKVMYNLNTEQTIVTSETTRKVKMRIVSTDLSTKMKFEEGEEATAYSPYGQGSVEIKKINSNIMPIQTEKYWEYTENGIKNKANSVGKTITEFTIKKGQTIKIGFIAFTKPSENTTFTCQINDMENSSLNIARFNNFNLNQKYEFSYTAMEDVVFKYVLNGNSANEIFEFQLWANLENAEDYQQYEEQSYILDIQKPMLLGDYFVKEADGWKEVHIFGYVNTREVENLGVSLNTSNGEFRRYNAYNLVTDRKSGEYLKILCTHFKRTDSRWHENEGICGWETGQSFCIGTFNTNYDTVDRMKTFLQNNDVGIYYELATPTKLACTEEQSAILDQLSELELFAGTNNIITAESLALMQMQYIADTQSYIDSKLSNINQQILEIAGGN